MATSIEDAWGSYIEKQESPVALPESPTPPRRTSGKRSGSSKAGRKDSREVEEGQKLLAMILNELRKKRNEEHERHRQLLLIISVSVGLLVTFLVLSWHSHQKATNYLSILMWNMQQSGTVRQIPPIV